MSWVPGFDYDVFLSYARVDNSTAAGDPEVLGWVTRFHKHLSVALGKKVGDAHAVTVFRDTRIGGNQLFDRTIEDALRRSAIFLALTSTGYLRSKHCLSELQGFFSKAQQESIGVAVGDHSRIFNVLLNNLQPSRWPAEFGRAAGFRFHDAETTDGDGDPLAETSYQFSERLKDVVSALDSTMSRLRAHAPTPPAAAAETPAKPLLFLAYTSEAMDGVRKRIVKELEGSEQMPIRVAPAVPPPLEAQPHDETVRASVAAADLSVHLLDATPGREVHDCEGSHYPQRQVELALKHGQSQLILIPQGVTPDTIADDSHREFLVGLEHGRGRDQTACCVQRGLPSAMTQQILDHVAQLQSRRPAARRVAPDATLLDTHVKDQGHAFELSEYLRRRNVPTHINPMEDDPALNILEFAERLKQVSILIVFYGAVPLELVRARLELALHLRVAQQFALKAFGIYMAPPLPPGLAPAFSWPWATLEWMDHTTGFNPAAVDQLLQRAHTAGDAP
jgi:hypothetical protein